MGTTVLVDLETFVADLLPPLSAGLLDIPAGQLREARKALNGLFFHDADAENQYQPSHREDTIAKTVVRVINDIELPNGYKAVLWRCNADPSDPSGAKVAAAIYPVAYLPSNGRPDWTHARFHIDFRQGLSKYDPWEDKEGEFESPEADVEERAEVRAQLIASAHNTFLYQQRTALFSLFVIGDNFRAARWDRSGVIVSRKVNYVRETEMFLQLLWRFALLDDEHQGLDPTATLLEERDHAFQMMDYLARPNPSVDVDYMDLEVPDVPTPTAPDSPASAIAPRGPDGIPIHSTVQQEVEDDLLPPEGDDPDLAVVEELDDDPRVFTYVREKFRDSLAPGWPRYKLRVGKDDRAFLVGKPLFFSSAMFGRATRGYVAVDTRTRRFVFLKDSWRPSYEGVAPEGRYLEMFAGDDSLLVPAFLCDGDVGGQCAYAAVYQDDPVRKLREQKRRLAARKEIAASAEAVSSHKKSKKRPREEGDSAGRSTMQDNGPAADIEHPDASRSSSSLHHNHYRIVVKDVCLPFDSFRSSEELVRLIYDCICTHYFAYTKYGIIHRDISAGNLLILPKRVREEDGREQVHWLGILTDWELAKPVRKDGTDDNARRPERTGTWQFMSVASVASQWTRPITVADELESFFHVLLFYGVRYLPHTLAAHAPRFAADYFDACQEGALPDGRRFCAGVKTLAVRAAQIQWGGVDLAFVTTTGRRGNPLDWLVRELLRLFEARYRVLEREEKLEALLKAQAAAPSPPPGPPPAPPTGMPARYRQPFRVTGAWKRKVFVPQDSLLPVPALDAATVARAAALDDHEAVLALCARMGRLEAGWWADTGVVGRDQLMPVGYEPRPSLLRAAEDSTSARTAAASGAARASGTKESRDRKRAKTGRCDSTFAVRLPVRAETDPVVPSLPSRDRRREGRAWA